MRSLAFLALLAPLVEGQTTLNVPADFSTIQAALDAASSGDTVKLAPGVYFEHVQLRENVNLVGSGQRRTFIDGGGTGDVVVADGVHKFLVENLTILGSKSVGGNPGAGVRIDGTPCCTFSVTAQIRRCRIVGNGDGIVVNAVHAGTLTLDKNTIDDNTRHGVSLWLGNTVLQQNTIVGNSGVGILATAGSGSITAHSNVIAYNGEQGLLRQPAAPTTLLYNDTYGNAGGDYMELKAGVPTAFAPAPGTGELSVDPGFVSVENGDYHPAFGSPLISAGNPILPLDFDTSDPEIGATMFLFAYNPASSNYGDGCGPQAGWFMEPLLGQGYFESKLSLAPPASPAVLLVGFNSTVWQGLPLPFDIGGFGATGCSLLTGPVLQFSKVTTAAGTAAQFLAIPNDPVLVGAKLYHQWMVSSPGANPLGFVFSDGVSSKILN